MTKKVSNINDRPRKKPRTLDESAKIAARRFLDPKYDSIEEPKKLASGKTNKPGEFVNDEEDESDE
jgi:hypothetical protein